MKRPVLIAVLAWAAFFAFIFFASLGDSSFPHIAAHVVQLALLVPAVRLIWQMKKVLPTRLQRVLSWSLSVTLPLAVVGISIELVAAVVRLGQDGWVNKETHDIWEHGAHMWAANLTVPSLMLSMVASLVLVAAAAIQRRRRLEPVG